MKKILSNRRGEADYITSVILIIIVVMMIVLVINVFSVVIVKQKLDSCADQMVRQIQLSGSVNTDTQVLFDTLTGGIYGITTPQYSVDTAYLSGSKIQLGTAFTVTIKAKVTFGGFGDMIAIPFMLTSKSAGVSEVYHKNG